MQEKSRAEVREKKHDKNRSVGSHKRDAWVIRNKKWWGVHIRAWQLVRFHTHSLLASAGIALAHMKAELSVIYGFLRDSPCLLFRVRLSDKATLSQVWQVDWPGKIVWVFMASVELLKQTDMWPLSKMLTDTINYTEAETRSFCIRGKSLALYLFISAG